MRKNQNLFLEWVVPLIIFACTINLSAQQKILNTFTLENTKVNCTVKVENSQLAGDRLETKSAWSEGYGLKSPASVETDADFALDVMYTDWQAPGKINNADNPVILTKKDFVLLDHTYTDLSNGEKELTFDFKGKETSIELRIKYSLGPEAFYVRRNIAVTDTAFGHHFLRWFWPYRCKTEGITSIIKNGGFGQPIAVLLKGGGAFFGIEYPSAENQITASEKNHFISCGEEYGEIIGNKWLQSDWIVEGVTPNSFVKLWFMQYLNDIRVAPLRPYSLYNTWYDLRSPEYPKWSPDKIMSEETALKMVDILRKNMTEKYKINLDAFVLDDGWDVYESDWVARKEQWPNGMKPLCDELKKTNTSLGLWVGPTGGYSFRMRRINWMKDHGYEVVGKTRNDMMLCLAGKNYSELLKKRVTDFVQNDGIGYYKWDGIQFSCSEKDHGHPIDIYSRRAVLKVVADMCNSVRKINPDIFLNITSGTWLSPWWLMYANTIWMQGSDYGFADVPSISRRDAAMTYRDFILYDDFNIQKFWFPIANLMTHGIIKGKNESVGIENEPLDKFTDDVLLYFARGVSMYELYISPDILTEGEWTSLSRAMAWARDRFPVLMNTEMVGGNPLNKEAYAYVHFKENKCIIAARNPVMEPKILKVNLDPGEGLDPNASSLVLERVYPAGWISPKLYKAGETASINLDGFETAVYEIYPLSEATTPLIAGAVFAVPSSVGNEYIVQFHSASADAKLLNPTLINSAAINGIDVNPNLLSYRTEGTNKCVTNYKLQPDRNDKSKITVQYTLTTSTKDAVIAVLLTPLKTLTSNTKPNFLAIIDGKEKPVKTEPQEGKSQWYMIEIPTDTHTVLLQVKPGTGEKKWEGTADLWIIANQKEKTKEIHFILKNEPKIKPMPPFAWNPGEIRKNIKLGQLNIESVVSR